MKSEAFSAFISEGTTSNTALPVSLNDDHKEKKENKEKIKSKLALSKYCLIIEFCNNHFFTD